VNVLVDPANGLLADKWCLGAVTESFIVGTEPTTASTTCVARTVPMPDVLGKTLAAAQAIFAKLGIKVEVTQLVAAASGAGTIVQQIPSAGIHLTRDSIVRLFVPIALAPPAAPPGGTTTDTTPVASPNPNTGPAGTPGVIPTPPPN